MFTKLRPDSLPGLCLQFRSFPGARYASGREERKAFKEKKKKVKLELDCGMQTSYCSFRSDHLPAEACQLPTRACFAHCDQEVKDVAANLSEARSDAAVFQSSRLLPFVFGLATNLYSFTLQCSPRSDSQLKLS